MIYKYHAFISKVNKQITSNDTAAVCVISLCLKAGLYIYFPIY